MVTQIGGWNRDLLDREYSPSSCAPGYRKILRDCDLASARALVELPHRPDLGYGPDPVETLHFFPAARHPAPLLVFVHGGHWQESSKDESCFPALEATAAGAAYAALGYGLAPGRRLGEMVTSVLRGLCWIRENVDELGVDPARIVVSGSSAGAHLAAAALGVPAAPRVAGACLLSGVYDLEPIRHCYVNDVVGMTADDVARYSPLHRVPLRADAIVLALGQDETREYGRQQRMFADSLRRVGQRCRAMVVPERNHFDLPMDLCRSETQLGAAVFDMLRP